MDRPDSIWGSRGNPKTHTLHWEWGCASKQTYNKTTSLVASKLPFSLQVLARILLNRFIYAGFYRVSTSLVLLWHYFVLEQWPESLTASPQICTPTKLPPTTSTQWNLKTRPRYRCPQWPTAASTVAPSRVYALARHTHNLGLILIIPGVRVMYTTAQRHTIWVSAPLMAHTGLMPLDHHQFQQTQVKSKHIFF